MPIEILSSRRRFRRFIVYDMEWIPGSLHVRVVGTYDGERYRHYATVEAFLRSELTSENRGKWFYAHAGGLADVQFVLEALGKIDAFKCHVVRSSFSGSSAIIVRVTRGKNSWTFIDSYWLLRDKLANIAKAIGMRKTGPDEDWSEEEIARWYATVDIEELTEYNENDCRILYRAIEEFELALMSYGGQLQMTLASSAMALFRRRFLRQGIETHDSVNDKARLSYVASRVEVFRRNPIPPFDYFDVNSLFPYAMTFALPGELIGVSRNLPLPGNLYIADVMIEVPDFYLTPTPVRLSGRVFFPSGCWRGWYTNVDLELLQQEGGRILRVFQVLRFEPFHDLADYAKTIYAKRKAATDPFDKQVLKLLLNTLYGKFAESSEKSMVHLHPTETTLARLSRENMLFPGCFEETIKVPVPHMWVPISTFITAIGRRTLYNFLSMTRHFYYCDTDGFPSKDPFTTGPELGELKCEKTVKEIAEYVAPKLYRMDDKVKAKGFSLGWDENKQHKKQKAIELFEDLVNGGEVVITRMRRIKENLRSGSLTPREEKITKRLNQKAISKRYHHPKTGVSRPWTIKELRGKGLK